MQHCWELEIENWKLKNAKWLAQSIDMDRLIAGNFQSPISNPQFPISMLQNAPINRSAATDDSSSTKLSNCRCGMR